MQEFREKILREECFLPRIRHATLTNHAAKVQTALAEVYYKISLEAPGERLKITWTSFLE
jgi:hypothetical protein